jgi:hypothetical protein
VTTFGQVQGMMLQLAEQAASSERPLRRRYRLRDLLEFGRAMIEARALGGRAREVVGALGSAVVVANPAFVMALVATSIAVLVMTALGALSGLIFLL